MLISLRVNNCYIYNEEIEFSMRANMHYKKFPTNVVNVSKSNILKSAIVFGPNNSGKTNFVRCLRMVQGILLNARSRIVKNLFTENNLCEFTVVFMVEEQEYVFEVKYDVKEKKYVYERFAQIEYDDYKNKKEINLIVRDNINKIYICEDHTLCTAMTVAAQNNILIYLLDTSQFDVLNTAKNILISFASRIDILDMNNIPISKTLEMLKRPNHDHQKIVNFILNADLSLEDYRYLDDAEFKLRISRDDNEDGYPQEKALGISESFVEMLHLTSFYNGQPVPSVIFDSTGTKKIAALASYVIDALEHNRILVIDELDNSLHFKLTRAIIALFNNELNSGAQLIATVHDVSLLDCQTLFRKEQIWFAHKDTECAYLYSLAEFTSGKDKIRDTTDLIEKYKRGVFGAMPEPDLFESLLEVRGNG